MVLNIHSKLEHLDQSGGAKELREADFQTTVRHERQRSKEPVHIGLFHNKLGPGHHGVFRRSANGMEFAGGTFTFQYDPGQIK